MPQQKFKVEDGLLVRGQANVTGNLIIDGTLSLGNNIVTNVTVSGNVVPETDNTYTLGTDQKRWIVYAQSIDVTEPIIAESTATFGNNITVSGNIQFTSNGYAIGSPTTQVIVYSTNTVISDTLSIGTNGGALTVNSTKFVVSSNIETKGTTISVANGALEQTFLSGNNVAIALGNPSSVIDEVDKSKFNAYRYFIRVTSNASNNVSGSSVSVGDMYVSEIVLALLGNTVHVSEYNQVFNNTKYMNFAGTTTDTKIRLVANSFVNNVNFTAVRTALK